MATFIPHAAYPHTKPRRSASTAVRGLWLSFVYAAFIALTAQIWVNLPFTDVPITLQVFGVLVAGGMLGPRWGTLSVVEYIAAGAAGMPVFAQGKFGATVLLGPTGGYLIGFVLAAAFVGYAVEKSRSKFVAALALLVSLTFIWAGGALWRHFWIQVPWSAIMATSILPFMGADVLKAVLAWVVITGTPRLTGRE